MRLCQNMNVLSITIAFISKWNHLESMAYKPKDPQPLNSLVEKLMKPILADHGAMTYVLLTQWPRVMGDALAHCSAPQKLMWPRQKEGVDERAPATLVLHVSDGGTALQIQQDTPQILQRINALYGWKAVGALKIKQVLQLRAAPVQAAPLVVPPEIAEHVEHIVPQGDDELRNSLLRLGNAIFCLEKGTNAPQK